MVLRIHGVNEKHVLREIETNAAAALEVMSRYAVDPRWLIHLPPTMSPAETSAVDGWLERPEEAFAFYGSKGVGSVIHPQAWLADVLARILDTPQHRLSELLPWNWRQPIAPLKAA